MQKFDLSGSLEEARHLDEGCVQHFATDGRGLAWETSTFAGQRDYT